MHSIAKCVGGSAYNNIVSVPLSMQCRVECGWGILRSDGVKQSSGGQTLEYRVPGWK